MFMVRCTKHDNGFIGNFLLNPAVKKIVEIGQDLAML